MCSSDLLRGADLSGARLAGARLENADLRGATIEPSALLCTQFNGAHLDLIAAIGFARAHGLRVELA